MDEYILLMIALITIFMMYVFILRPINRCHEAVLNHLLAKEIARKMYQEIHPKFSYKAYHEDDVQRQIILNSSVEEFRRLLSEETTIKSKWNV